MIRTMLGAGAAAIALGISLAAAANTTTRVFQPGGQGYVDETRNDRGDLIRTQTHDADGRLTNDTSYDPNTREPTGSTEHTYDGASTRPETTTRRDGDGDPRSRQTFDGEGRVARSETYDEDGIPETRTEYNYNENGELTDINVFDGSGNLTTSHHYSWENGRLTNASSMDHTGEHPENDGNIFYNPDGSISEMNGNVDGALAALGLPGVDPNTHTTTDANGNRITVTHNPDGTFDVTVVHPDRRVTTGHLRHGAGCYLGDGCPFGSRPGTAPAGTSNTAETGAGTGNTAETTPGEPISQGPARTGGTPADVHVPLPSLGAGQHHRPSGSPAGNVSRPPSRGGRY